jgi:hypothetical protein
MAALRYPSVGSLWRRNASTIHPSNHRKVLTFIALYIRNCSPEPHILLFRRQLGTDPQTGRVDPNLLAIAKNEFKDQLGLRRNAVA